MFFENFFSLDTDHNAPYLKLPGPGSNAFRRATNREMRKAKKYERNKSRLDKRLLHNGVEPTAEYAGHND